jgi:hypothetical protein
MHSWCQAAVNDIASYWPLSNNRQRPTIEVCFTDSMDLNAQAVLLQEAPDHYAILMSDAPMIMLRDNFWRLLAHRDCFPDVGDPTLEEVGEPTLERLERNVEDFLQKGEGTYVAPRVKCEKRALYAELMAHHAALSIALHELGHIGQGHVLLRKSGIKLEPIQWRSPRASS